MSFFGSISGIHSSLMSNPFGLTEDEEKKAEDKAESIFKDDNAVEQGTTSDVVDYLVNEVGLSKVQAESWVKTKERLEEEKNKELSLVMDEHGFDTVEEAEKFIAQEKEDDKKEDFLHTLIMDKGLSAQDATSYFEKMGYILPTEEEVNEFCA